MFLPLSLSLSFLVCKIELAREKIKLQATSITYFDNSHIVWHA